jgi:hypothetical protein
VVAIEIVGNLIRNVARAFELSGKCFDQCGHSPSI